LDGWKKNGWIAGKIMYIHVYTDEYLYRKTDRQTRKCVYTSEESKKQDKRVGDI
jgi:hypothetical protein